MGLASLRSLLFLFLAAPGVAFGAGTARYSGPVASADKMLRPPGAHRTLGAVLPIALDQLQKQGVAATNFEAVWFSYRCLKKASCEWFIGFEAKEFIWNGQRTRWSMTYSIAVNDQTGSAYDASPQPPEIDGK